MKKNKKNLTLEGVNPSIVKDYACEDIDLTMLLHDHMLPKILEINLQSIMQLDCNFVPVLADMEYNGVLIDAAKLLAFEKTIDEELRLHLKEIEEVTEGKVNIDSKVQLSKLLFEELNLTPIGKKGKSGYYSVSSEVLKQLGPQHRIIGALLAYNALKKVKITFIKALKRTNPKTSRLHTSFNQTVTETGRLSSSNPNLQNIPSRTYGKVLRECFIAPAGYKLIGADYSNIELRVMAVYSQDPEMLGAYNKKIDLHSLTASKIFAVPDVDKVEEKLRNVGKTVNFGLIYGMSAVGLSQRLSRGEDVYSVEQCTEFIRQYFDLYSGVAKCREELIYKASTAGYTETMFGRRRSIPEINSSDSIKRDAAKRLAMNTPIQGTAADILKVAMVNLHSRIKRDKLPLKMLLQVHDELLFEAPDSEAKLMLKVVREEMENAVKLQVPLKVDAKIGTNWKEVH